LAHLLLEDGSRMIERDEAGRRLNFGLYEWLKR
jgi:hypothetical protein